MLDEAINRPAWADGDAMGSGTSFDDLHRDSGGGRRIPKLRNYESLVKIGMVSRESAFLDLESAGCVEKYCVRRLF